MTNPIPKPYIGPSTDSLLEKQQEEIDILETRLDETSIHIAELEAYITEYQRELSLLTKLRQRFFEQWSAAQADYRSIKHHYHV